MQKVKPTRAEKLHAAHERPKDAVGSIVTSNDWQRMLKVVSRFHRDSPATGILKELEGSALENQIGEGARATAGDPRGPKAFT